MRGHKVGLGDLPQENFVIKMTKEATLFHFETIFACKPQLILQAL